MKKILQSLLFVFMAALSFKSKANSNIDVLVCDNCSSYEQMDVVQFSLAPIES